MYGEILQRWKHCFVSPTLKKEPVINPENYRPVSVTSALCRLTQFFQESTINNTLVVYVVMWTIALSALKFWVLHCLVT